jgi:hypothetical protein
VAIAARWAAECRGDDQEAFGEAVVGAYDAVFPRERPRQVSVPGHE